MNDYIPISELEVNANVNQNRLRSKVSRDTRYNAISVGGKSCVTVKDAVKLLNYLITKDKDDPESVERYNAYIEELESVKKVNGLTESEKTVSKPVNDATKNVNGLTESEKTVHPDDEPLTVKGYTVNENVPKVVSFMRGPYWQGFMALLAVTVSSFQLSIFIKDAAELLTISLHPLIPYVEGVIFSLIGLTMAASNRDKTVTMGGDDVSVANIWLFVFFVMEALALSCAWGLINNVTVKIAVLSLMPPITLLAFGHLFIGNKE